MSRMFEKGLDILFYQEGWRYAKLLSHDGTIATVIHPVHGKLRVKLTDVKLLSTKAKLSDFLESKPAPPAKRRKR